MVLVLCFWMKDVGAWELNMSNFEAEQMIVEDREKRERATY